MKSITVAGLKAPCAQLVMGSDHFNSAPQNQVSLMLDKFVEEAGGNTIDTAENYGESERAIGRWMKMRGNRDKILILTKGAHPYDGPRVNPQAITADLTGSLERLQTDFVDMYALHRDDPGVPVGPIIDVLNEHINAGKIRVIGASNWTHHRIREANEYAEQHGLKGFAFSSTNLSLAKPNVTRWPGSIHADEAACAWHKETGIPLFSWSSLAGGFLSGRFSPDRRDNQEMVRVYYSDENWLRVERAKRLAEEKGVTAVQIALAYVMNQPFPTCALVAAHTPEELKSNRAAADIVLTETEIRWLDLADGRNGK